MDKYTGMLLDGRYELLEPIGYGGMAVVYKARCHRLNRLVAVKILKEEYSKDADFKRRFETESRAVAMLSHPNIVSVYDVSRSEGLEYIVMELIDGMSLKDYMLKRGRLGWRETLHFATLIAKALEHAHSRGVIHRDIKPHNIMVLRDGSVKVADFGIARFTTSQHTLTQEALGSVHYISPEQARGSQLDASRGLDLRRRLRRVGGLHGLRGRDMVAHAGNRVVLAGTQVDSGNGDRGRRHGAAQGRKTSPLLLQDRLGGPSS